MWNDLLQTGRITWRQWPVTLTLVLLIGAGVACGTAMFSVIDGLLFKPLPFPDAAQLVAVGARDPHRSGPTPLNSRQVAELTDLGVLRVASYSQTLRKGDPLRDDLQLAVVSEAFFEVLGVGAQIGRVPGWGDAADRSIALSHSAWQSRYGGARSVVGQPLTWNGTTYTIVGVLPPFVDFPGGAQAWVISPPAVKAEGMASLHVIGRLTGGRSLASAAALLPAHVLVPLREFLRPGGAFALLMLLVATCLVLGVAWVQVAAMQFTRAARRSHEIQVRIAIGASRWHLVRYGAAEGLWLAAGALVTAAVLTPTVTRFITTQLPPQMTRGQLIHVDQRVMAFAILGSTIGVLAFALAPLWRGGRPTITMLRGTSGQLTSGQDRTWMMIAQVAVAVPLIYLAGLAWLSSVRLSQVDLGFSAEGLFAVRLPRDDLSNRDRHEAMLSERRVRFRELQAMAGVVSVSAGSDLPFGGRNLVPLTLNRAERGEQVQALMKAVEPAYFSTLGIPLTSGRTFEATDSRAAPLVVIVNEVIASRLRARGSGVTTQIRMAGHVVQVVGVAGNTRDDMHPSRPPEPQVYVPAGQWIPPDYMFVRLQASDPLAQVRLRSALARLWPDVQLNLSPVADMVHNATADYRGRSTLLLLLAACALSLTMLGIHGAVSALTRARTGEIAIRIICGADPGAIATGVVWRSLRSVAIGVAAGLLLGWGCARATSSLLFATDPSEIVMMAAVSTGLLITAFAAAVRPALRASRIEPAAALRDQ